MNEPAMISSIICPWKEIAEHREFIYVEIPSDAYILSVFAFRDRKHWRVPVIYTAVRSQVCKCGPARWLPANWWTIRGWLFFLDSMLSAIVTLHPLGNDSLTNLARLISRNYIKYIYFRCRNKCHCRRLFG